MKNIKKHLRKLGVSIALVGTLGAGLFYASLRNSAEDSLSRPLVSSSLRKEFKNKFGISLEGRISKIEDNPENIMILAFNVYRENLWRPFGLSTIKFQSNYYLDRPLTLFLHRPASFYLHTSGKVLLLDGTGWSFMKTVAHEVKHARTFQTSSRLTKLLKDWDTLSRDENGVSLYWPLDIYDRYMSFSRGSLPQRFCDDEKNLSLGFISQYSRANAIEDIAELTAFLELYPSRVADPIFEHKNERMRRKVELAMEYGIIPKESLDFLCLDHLFMEWIDANREEACTIEDTYFDKSTEFLTRYTNSIFADAVWTRRAEIFKGYQEKGSGREDIYLAIEEFRNALEAPYKSDYYVFALKNLADIYRNIIRDKGTTEAFDLAVKEYYRRYQNADLSLPRLGVNDFLEVKGINLN